MPSASLIFDVAIPDAGDLNVGLFLLSCSLTVAMITVTVILKPYRSVIPAHSALLCPEEHDPPPEEPPPQPSIHSTPRSSPSSSQDGNPSTSEDQSPLSPPSRSKTHGLYQTKAGEQIDRVLRRTRSFSVHFLSNGAKTIKAGPITLKNQIASKGRTVLHHTRAFTHHPTPIAEEPSSSSGGSDQNSDQSSAAEAESPQKKGSPAPATPAPAVTIDEVRSFHARTFRTAEKPKPHNEGPQAR
ncbi:hypothetical protein BD414DRAFT_539450 [Trametes punicea]|nr:hypothetical protein BD414DRAFT_539450 [Trametes punicea]